MTYEKQQELAYELRHEEADKPRLSKNRDLMTDEERSADMQRFVAQCMADPRYNRGRSYRRTRWSR